MPAPEPRRPAAFLAFGTFIVLALAVAYVFGHMTGRTAVHEHYKRLSPNAPREDRMQEFNRFAN